MNKIAVTLLPALAGGGSFATAAEPTEGVLEKGTFSSVLFAVNPWTDDLIGYAFKKPSTLSKAILGNCLSGRLYWSEKSATRLMADPRALNLEGNPLGWMKITMAHGMTFCTSAPASV